MCISDVYGPCSCPHGRMFTVAAQLFTLVAWITSVATLSSCVFLRSRTIPEEGEAESSFLGYGFLARQVYVNEAPSYGSQCIGYDYSAEEKQELDATWRVGLAMSALATIIGGLVMFAIFGTCCVAFTMPAFEGLFWTTMLCGLMQALAFVALGSDILCGDDDKDCAWGKGSGINITATFLWIWAANMIKSFPEVLPTTRRRRSSEPPEPSSPSDHQQPPIDDEDEDDEEYHQESPSQSAASRSKRRPDSSFNDAHHRVNGENKKNNNAPNTTTEQRSKRREPRERSATEHQANENIPTTTNERRKR